MRRLPPRSLETRLSVDLPTRIARRPLGRFLIQLVIIGFVVVQLSFLVRGFLPATSSYRQQFPWGMFKEANRKHRVSYAIGIRADGDEQRIPLDRIFHYTRGATDLRFYDHHPALIDDSRYLQRERGYFALHIAEWMEREEGVRFEKIRFERHRTELLGKRRTKVQVLGEVELRFASPPSAARGRR